MVAGRNWLTFEEVAEEFAVSVQTVRNWTKAENGPRLEATRFGKRLLRTSRDAVERFIQVSNPQLCPAAPMPRQSSSAEVDRYLREAHGL